MRVVRNVAWIAVVAAFLTTGFANAQTSLLKQLEAEFVDLSDIAAPSVVEIKTEGPADESSMSDIEDLFRQLRPPGSEDNDVPSPENREPRMRKGMGSGFMFDTDGHIVTNNHVVRDAELITVQLHDGSEYPAVIVGQDESADIAVIRIDAPPAVLAPVIFADSDTLKPGQFAVALGSPRGLTGSFSYGHVTGLAREELDLPESKLRFQDFIQTDAGINLGNSGGPLLNLDGEVIGMNIAIVYGANSIGFAIPGNRVLKVVPQLIDTGEVTRGWIGVSILDIEDVATDKEIDVEDYVEAYDLPDEFGASVRATNPDGPARAAGLLEDDVIRRINEFTIKDAQDVINVASDLLPGAVTELEIWREGESQIIEMAVSKWPGQAFARYGRPYLGIHVSDREDGDEIKEEYELENAPNFIVADVVKGSPADEAGITKYDFILEVARTDAWERDEFAKLMEEKAKPGKTLLVKIFRPTSREELEKFVKVPEDVATQ